MEINRLIHYFQKSCKSIVFVFSLVNFGLNAQTFTDSNLPIIIINTDGNAGIPDAPRILANMKIVYKGAGIRNALTDLNDPSALNYDGRINIEVRGSSSQALDKKQYGLTTLMADNTTNNNISLLGMPPENDWVLNSLPFEPSLIRDYISYTLSRAIGEYAPRAIYCEVMINGNYRGLYMLQEKVKIDDNRVNIVKIDQQDNALPDITGGYLIKADKVTVEDPPAWAMSSYLGTNDVNFIHEFPKPGDITVEQSEYIKYQFSRLAFTAAAGNSSAVDGYPSIIDLPSFINFMIINELSANVDAYQFSTFFHKDKRGKLRAGPLWDLNLTYGNDLFMWGFDRSKTNTWQFDNGDNIGARFWNDLFNNSTFRCYISKRWNALTEIGQPLELQSINNLIDQTVSLISEAVIRENSRWGTIGNHNSKVDTIKNFLTSRLTWISNSLGSFAACNNITVPSLVISKIMYQPPIDAVFSSSSDQEFVEIVNNSNGPVDLTGIYFSGTGFSYQFPPGVLCPPQGILQLANHLETFEQRYNISAFGEFARNLNNNGQLLTLSDAFGNIIDEVNYSNQAPWPASDGNGRYLKLQDINSDNNMASNWIASNEPLTTNVIAGIDEEIQLDFFPNPVSDILSIKSNSEIDLVQLYSIDGTLIESKYCHTNSTILDVSKYTPGVYWVVLTMPGKAVVRKFVKIP